MYKNYSDPIPRMIYQLYLIEIWEKRRYHEKAAMRQSTEVAADEDQIEISMLPAPVLYAWRALGLPGRALTNNGGFRPSYI